MAVPCSPSKWRLWQWPLEWGDWLSRKGAWQDGVGVAPRPVALGRWLVSVALLGGLRAVAFLGSGVGCVYLEGVAACYGLP